MTTNFGKVIKNEFGFSQYIDMLDEYCCPNCELIYINEGAGILCEDCDESKDLKQSPPQSDVDEAQR